LRLDQIAHPAQVVELQVARVGEVDVRRVHVAVAQQPPGGAAAVALDDEVAGRGEDLGPGAAARHRVAG
jgi:hypothetical protein